MILVPEQSELVLSLQIRAELEVLCVGYFEEESLDQVFEIEDLEAVRRKVAGVMEEFVFADFTGGDEKNGRALRNLKWCRKIGRPKALQELIHLIAKLLYSLPK